VRGSTICGLARCNEKDIDRAWDSLRDAPDARIHVFLATSAIHRGHKLNMAKEQIIHTAVEGVKYARSLCEDIEFSPEDASRTEPEFLREVVEAVIEAGATTINVPDTVGYSMPHEYGEMFTQLYRLVPELRDVVLRSRDPERFSCGLPRPARATRTCTSWTCRRASWPSHRRSHSGTRRPATSLRSDPAQCGPLMWLDIEVDPIRGTTAAASLIGNARLRLVAHATGIDCRCCGRCGHVGDAPASSKCSVMSTALTPSAPMTLSRQHRHRGTADERLTTANCRPTAVCWSCAR